MRKVICGLFGMMVFFVFAATVQAKDFDVTLDVSGMKEPPRAQDDFYVHVNYEWLKNTQIPADEGRVDGFSALDQRVRERLQVITEGSVQKLKTGTANHDEKNIAALYACIQDTKGRERSSLGSLAVPLARIEKIDTVQDYAEAMAGLSRDLGTHGLIGSFSVDHDPYENDACVVWLDPPDTGLRHEFLTDPANAVYFSYYQAYIRDILTLYGRTPETAAREAKEIFALQKELAKHSLPMGQLYSTTEAVHPLELSRIRSIYKGLDAEKMLAAGGIAPADGVIHWYMSDPVSIKWVNEMLTPEKLPVFKEYAIFRLLSEHSACLSPAYAEAAKRYNQAMSGAAEGKSPTRENFELCEKLLEESYGRQYAKRYFAAADCRDVEDYAKKIIAAYRNKLKNMDWLTKATRQRALVKLDTMKLNIGYPSVWPDYLDQDAVQTPAAGGCLIDNVLMLERHRRLAEMSSIGKPVRRDIWRGMVPQTVNAFYYAADNSINFPAGILQAPLYDKKAEAMQNLGGIGMLIAHEITHSFDSSGAQYDEKGRIRNWWTLQDRQAYANRQQRISYYYLRYRFPDGSWENGRRTLMENTADLGALSCLTDLAGNNIEDLRRLYTSYAMTWRDKMTTAKFRSLLTDSHAISAVRVNAVLSSTDAFYKAFAVQAGDGMYVEPKERVRLW